MPNLKDFPQRAVHLDFHTMPGVCDVGRDFDADRFADTLAASGVQYVTVFARCNLGFAYYPTRLGIVHPGLGGRDLLGGMVRACHQRQIAVAAYFNAGLDHEHARLHRDWVKVNAEGQVYEMRHKGHFFRKMCLNTGYGEHLLGMVREVLRRYPVDGIFLDCFNLDPCYGAECLEPLLRDGHAPDDAVAARQHCWQTTHAFTRRVIALTHALRKDARVYFNGLPYASQPTHIELEILPTGGWGYDILPAHVRYARTLHKPLFVMTGRFHRSWGDFGGLRSEHSLLFDCCNAIANGGGCSVGDHMHPRGRLDAPVYDTIGRVFARVRALDAWSHQAHALADIAVISPHMAAVPAGPEPMPPAAWQATHGASRLLMELKCQFDVCDGSGDLSGYALLILPDDLPLTPELRRCIAAHLRCGGALLGSASAGVDAAKRAFVWPGYPAVFAGTEPFDPTYFEALSPVARDIPAMPIAIYTPGIAMRAAPGARVWARLWRPYFNRAAWDGCHEHLYTPPEKRLTRPAVVGRGRLAHFAFPVFGDYGLYAMPAAKYLVRNCIEKLLPRPLVKVEGMPSFGQVTVTAQKRRRMAHLLTYVPELRGPEMQVIEEPCVARDVALALRCDAARPVRRVYLAPGGENLPWREADGYIHTRVPAVEGYQMVVFE